MAVEHHVPASRLTRSYFRRWWFMKGSGRHRLEQIHPTTELGIDLSQVRRSPGYRDTCTVRPFAMPEGISGLLRRAMCWVPFATK